MTRTVVGVLRGGTSQEYNLSLKTGGAMLAALPEEKYETRDILVDKAGYWYWNGKPVTPARALSQLDVVLNAIHGGVGEDGTVQRIFDRSGVPYAGSRALPSSMALNKARAYQISQKRGIPIPRSVSITLVAGIDVTDLAQQIFQRMGPPYIVKPVSEGASHGIRYVATLIDLPTAMAEALEVFGAIKVQEYLRGEQVSVGVVENFRGEELYALPPVQTLIPKDSKILSFDHLDKAEARHIVPSNFSHEDKERLLDLARTAHRALGLAHYSRSDFILTRHGPYFLEANAVPGLYAGSPLIPALESVGSSVPEFVQHAIILSRG